MEKRISGVFFHRLLDIANRPAAANFELGEGADGFAFPGQDRGGAKLVQRLQEGPQRARQQGRERERHGDAPGG